MGKLNLAKAGASPKVTRCWNQAYRKVMGRAFLLCQAAFSSSPQISRAERVHSSASQSFLEARMGQGREDSVRVGNAGGTGGCASLRAGPQFLERQAVKH